MTAADPRRSQRDLTRRRRRWLLRASAASAVVLAANLAVVAGDALQSQPTSDHNDLVVAALAMASTAEAPIEVDLDPFEGIEIPAPAPEPVEEAIDLDTPLPRAEVPPHDPYAPTPEVRHGMLEIPAIGLSQPLFEGVTLTAINRGPSHWPGTAMPGGIGNVVVAGHRTTYTRPFWDLQAVAPGDELIFSMNNGSRFVYVLDETEVVSPTDVHILEQSRARTATLFGCHPRGSARQRIVGHFTFSPERSTIARASTTATIRLL